MTSYLCNRSADWLLTVTGRGWFQWDRTQTHAHRTTRIRSHAGTSHRHSEIAAHPSNTPSTAPPLPLRGLAVYRLSATEGTFMTCHQSLSCTEAFRNILNLILPLSIRLSASYFAMINDSSLPIEHVWCIHLINYNYNNNYINNYKLNCRIH